VSRDLLPGAAHFWEVTQTTARRRAGPARACGKRSKVTVSNERNDQLLLEPVRYGTGHVPTGSVHVAAPRHTKRVRCSAVGS